MFEWAYSGVDHTLPGNGGQECVDFLPTWQRVSESGLVCLFSLVMLRFAWTRLRLPDKIPPIERSDRCGKRVLLVVMCLTFGIELGFKFATRQFIWIFNPCHITSMIQIYLLAAPPSKLVTAVFRLHLHMLSGAPIAIIFPVINTRLLPFEAEIYYIQHILMMIIPFYLMRVGGVYTPEKLGDLSWVSLSLGWLYFFHFVPLSYLAYISQVNLNNMLCPAVSDPFYGRTYRIFAMCHQILAIPLIGKIIVGTSHYFRIAKRSTAKETLVFIKEKHSEIREEESSNHSSRGVDQGINKNGVVDPVIKEKNGVLNKQTEDSQSIRSHSGNGHPKMS